MYLKKYNLKNKYALVTGAGKGLGKACAIALAEAGCNLIIVSRTKKDLDGVSKIIKKLKVKCKSYTCDVTNYNEIKTITAPRLSKVGEINNEAKITSLTSNDFIYIYDNIGVLRAKIPINSIELGTNNKQTITLN